MVLYERGTYRCVGSPVATLHMSYSYTLFCNHTVYISGRPFVLRDASEPRRTLKMSDRAENLEAIELRLKNDILLEAHKYGGLILTHNEVGESIAPLLLPGLPAHLSGGM